LTKLTLLRLCAGVAAFALVGCSTDCAEESCMVAGTYVDPNDSLGAESAEICFDDDCHTMKAIEGNEDVFLGFNRDDWHEGREFRLRITVFDAKGQVIDTLSEQRTMDSSRCGCGVLFYDWHDGRLHRAN
jgi:hypothetical protein